MKKLRC